MTTKKNSFAKAARGRLQGNCSTDFHQPSALCACSKLYYSPSKPLKYTQQKNYTTHQNQSQEIIKKKARIFYIFFKKGIDKSIFAWYNNQALAKRSSKRCGGVAQLARATGSYPVGHGFKSNLRYQWPVGQAAKTPPFHGGNGSSILPRVTKKDNVRTFSSDVIFLSKPQAWYGINALTHCMESPKAYGITRKRVYVSPCGLIPYITS